MSRGRKIQQLRRPAQIRQPRHSLLNPKFRTRLYISQSHAPLHLIQRPSLHNDHPLGRLVSALLINTRSAVRAEVDRERHAAFVGKGEVLHQVGARGDFEGAGGHNEDGGVGAAGDFVARVAVAGRLFLLV